MPNLVLLPLSAQFFHHMTKRYKRVCSQDTNLHIYNCVLVNFSSQLIVVVFFGVSTSLTWINILKKTKITWNIYKKISYKIRNIPLLPCDWVEITWQHRTQGCYCNSEVIYQVWDVVFHHQMKHGEESWKYDALRSIWFGNETLCQNILLKFPLYFLYELLMSLRSLSQNQFVRTWDYKGCQ